MIKNEMLDYIAQQLYTIWQKETESMLKKGQMDNDGGVRLCAAHINEMLDEIEVDYPNLPTGEKVSLRKVAEQFFGELL